MTYAVLAVLLAVSCLGHVWCAWPNSYQARHLVGHNPYASELDRAINARRRALRRSPAPWSQPPNLKE